MLQATDLIVFSDDWGRHPFSCQHLIARLLANNRVLWVNTVGYRRIKWCAYDIKRVAEKVSAWFAPTGPHTYTPHAANLRVISPPCLPFGKIGLVRRFNAVSVCRAVNRASKQWGFADPLLLTTLPSAADYLGHLGERLRIYYCVDDFTKWPGTHGALMHALEERLLSKVDVVIASSEKLAMTRRREGIPTHLITHGVDLEHFKSIDKAEPADILRSHCGPVVAYFGLIDERCDLPLLTQLAESMIDVLFLIIGPWRVKPGRLARLHNVRIVGHVPYNNLPAFLVCVSALILPYVVNELSESVNPLKLKEYLATGLPVVATPLPEVVKLGDLVNTAGDADGFRASLYRVLNAGRRYTPSLEAFLSQETWEVKAEQFSAIVQAALSASRNSQTHAC